MDEARTPALQRDLEDQTTAAHALRELAHSQPPTENDMVQAFASMHLVDLFLSDLNEALRQLFVAGLSFPDPELPSMLLELQERARSLYLATASERLGKLAIWLRATLSEANLDARLPLSSSAWDEAQRLLAWARLFKIEHDLRVVQIRMSAEAQGIKIDTEATFKTCSLSIWPVGLELAPSGKLYIYGISIDSKRTVVLVDHLADYSKEAPFSGRVISRMFQDGIDLSRLMRSQIYLEEHPFTEKNGALFFRPAFRTIPKILGVAESFKPPALPVLQVGLNVQIPTGPFQMEAAVNWSSGRLYLGSLRGEIPIRVSPLLRFNLAKLLVREGLRRDEISICLLAKEDEFELLSIQTALDGHVYPVIDSTVFRVARVVLQNRALRTNIPGSSITELFLRVATHTLGDGKEENIETLRQRALNTTPQGAQEHYYLAFTKTLLGLPLDPNKERPFLQEALAMLLRPSSTPVDLSQLSRLLGLPRSNTSPSDLRSIDGAFIYQVLWLIRECNLVDELRPLLEHLMAARFEKELKDTTVGEVCSRALLLAYLAQPTTGKIAIHPLPSKEEEEDDEEEEEGEFLDRTLEGWVKAQEFLEAHLKDLAPKKSTTKSRPLPELIELLQLGDTRAFLYGDPPLGQTLAPLNIPIEKLRHTCIEALLAWCAAIDSERPGEQDALYAANAILVVVASGQEQFFFS